MDKETTVTINSGTIADVTTKVDSAINALSQKLGVASDHFYPIMVKQSVMESAVWLAASIPVWMIFIFCAYGLVANIKKDFDQAVGFGFFGAFAFIIAAIITATNFPGIINPEYYALKEIMSFIK